MNKIEVISIDGPSASGKSTVARGIASKLNMIYVDSGALYRAITWHVLKNKINFSDINKISELIYSTNWNFYISDGAIVFSINEYQPTSELRTKVVRESVAAIASIKIVRKFIIKNLQSYIKFGSLVIEGRDIGSVVFPDTPYKFYLDAKPEERAKRRFNELEKYGEKGHSKDIFDSLKKRDQIDSTRDIDPLTIPIGAKIIDTTILSITEVIDEVIKEIKQ